MISKNSIFAVAMMAVAMFVSSASASVITIGSATASSGGDQYANGVPSIYNGSGITKTDANDPTTWSNSGSAYQDELMSWYLPAGATNNKLAWIAIDLSSPQSLGTLFLFNTNYQGGPSGVNSINIYYATSPTVGLPAAPNKNTFATTGLTPQGDYDFASGGWSLFGSSTAPKAGVGTYDMSGVTAQYIAIEVLSNHGDTYKGGRTGIDEIAVTAGQEIPEPASLVMGLVGIGLIAMRRRYA